MSEHETPCPHCDGWTDDHVFDCPDLVAVPASPPATGKSQSEWMELVGHPVPASPRAKTVGVIGNRDPHATVKALVAAPVASGTPKEERHISVRPDGTIRVCATDWPVSPAPAAPGVELDFEKADADSREEGSTWTSGYAQRYRKALNAQVRALVDAAASKAREEERKKMVNESHWRHIEGRYAPLLALVAEWQEARKAIRLDENTFVGELSAAQRYAAAEAALAAWRKG